MGTLGFRAVLRAFAAIVITLMLWATVRASLDRSVVDAAVDLWRDPWGRATLFDAYFAFLFVWLWMAWRTRGWTGRVLWLIAVLTLGNFAIAAYVLIAVARLAPDQGVSDLLLGPHRRASAPGNRVR